jgi:hypothetical protein
MKAMPDPILILAPEKQKPNVNRLQEPKEAVRKNWKISPLGWSHRAIRSKKERKK